MEAHTLTMEQEAIVDYATMQTGNLMINALAGTGKSATLKFIDQKSKTRPCLYLVYNKRNADEARKSDGFASTTTIKTFNALGHGIWAGACAHKLTLDKAKSRTLWRTAVDEMKQIGRAHV